MIKTLLPLWSFCVCSLLFVVLRGEVWVGGGGGRFCFVLKVFEEK